MTMRAQMLPVARADRDLGIVLGMANRHGLVAGATGTGKTVTLQVMAERFSRAGAPVLVADVKGDLSGIAVPGGDHAKVAARAERLGLELQFAGCPVTFWDVFGGQSHPLRAAVSEVGPLILTRLLSPRAWRDRSAARSGDRSSGGSWDRYGGAGVDGR